MQTPGAEGVQEPAHTHYDTRPRRFSRWRRMQIPVIAAAVAALIRIVGPTLRFESLGRHHYEQLRARGERAIGAFWHRCIFSAAWYWRNKGAVVMVTTNFDGEWVRRVVERFGFGSAQGSSSRGGLGGLSVMAERLEEGWDAAFTVDGPRGPRYVAKPGPVMLARTSGQPIYVFHFGLQRAYTFDKAWDLTQIPRLFSRAVMVGHPVIYVPRDAGAKEIEHKRIEVQRALERVKEIAESWFEISEAERERLRAEWNA